jgi:hypothetical protein
MYSISVIIWERDKVGKTVASAAKQTKLETIARDYNGKKTNHVQKQV